jgi:hypothetical protein
VVGRHHLEAGHEQAQTRDETQGFHNWLVDVSGTPRVYSRVT